MAKKLPDASDGCACNCEGSGLGVEGGSPNPVDQIIVRNAPGISIGNVINEYSEQGKKIFELDDFSLIKPVIAFSNNAPVLEVGETLAEVTFTGSITQGSYGVSLRSITPDPGGLNLSLPFSFQKTNVKRITAGTAESHTVSATDSEGNVSNKTSGIAVKNAVYQGFSALASLNQAQIKALQNKHLVDTIIAQYEGRKNYTVPGPDPQHIYFCGVVGTQAIAGAELSNLPLPLVDLPSVTVTNIHDATIQVTYWVKRTAVKFNPGTYQITLS